jgi:chromosomal replication initiator protein
VYQGIWNSCLQQLKDELPSQQFSMWIRPLQIDCTEDTLTLFAPNRFVLDWVREKYIHKINEILARLCGDDAPKLRFDVGNRPIRPERSEVSSGQTPKSPVEESADKSSAAQITPASHKSKLTTN